jgi:DNA-binding MarR family transcriptional regulator
MIEQTQLSYQVGSVIGDFSAIIMHHLTDDLLQLLRRENLSMPRMVALMFLARRSNATISDIGDHLNLTLGTTSQIVDQLVESGFVERRECREDRRQKLVTLSERGVSFVHEVRAARAAELSRQFSTLPEPLLGQMLEVMREVVAHLGRQTSDSERITTT